MEYKNFKYKLLELKIDVSYDCPLVCIHCSSDASPNSGISIPISKTKYIINEAIQLGVKKIAFSGGEPLMYDGIEELVKTVVENNIVTTIYTTGFVPESEEILNKLKRNGLNKAAFSLYSSDYKEHEYITRRSGSFEKTIESIKYAKQIGIETEIHFVALKMNYKGLEKLALFAKEHLDVDKLSVLRFVPQGRGSVLQSQELDNKEFINLRKAILKLRKDDYNIRTGSPLNFLLVNNQPKCNSGIDRLIVSPDLTFSPCDAFKQISSGELVGTNLYSDLNDYNLVECWMKSPYLNEVRKYLNTDFADKCGSCNKLKDCMSGCLAQKVLKYGKLVKVEDPNCLLN